jgi:hypothetical protein
MHFLDRQFPLTTYLRRDALSILMRSALVCGWLMSSAATPTHAAYSPPMNGLVAWWSADGNANDPIGGHNGSPYGAFAYAPGKFGQAFSIGDGGIVVPDSPGFQLTGSLTIGLWMKPTPSSWVAFCRGDLRSGLDPYAISMDRGTLGRVGLQITDASNNNKFLSAPIAGWNVWQQVTGTLDGATGDMRLYINGNLVAQDTTAIRPFGVLDPGQQPGIGIGNVPPPHNFPFQGALDEVVLYSRALSPSEVATLVPEPCTASLLLCGGLFSWCTARRRSAPLDVG